MMTSNMESQDGATNVKNETKVINVRMKNLNILGYKDFQEWIRDPNNVYIGRNMSHYVPGAKASKWGNPFHVKKYGRMQCVQMYKDYVKYDLKKYDGKTLWESLDELEGKMLGCWCHPDPCHGHVLLEILQERRENTRVPEVGTVPQPETTTLNLPPGLNPEMLQSQTPNPMSKSAKKNAKRKEKRKRERERVEDWEEYDLAEKKSDSPYFYTPPYQT